MLLLSLILLPLAAALVIGLCRNFSARFLDVLAITATLAVAALAGICLFAAPAKGVIMSVPGGWVLPGGTLLVIDGFSVFFLAIVSLLFVLVALYAAGYFSLKENRAAYYALVLLLQAGINGVLISGDFFSAFVCAELAVIAGYALTAYDGKPAGYEAAFKYTVLGSLSSLLILFAIGLLYAQTGSLQFAAIAHSSGLLRAPLTTAFILLFLTAGFGLKSTLVPFHPWVPDAYTAAPAPVSALFAGVTSKAVGLYLLFRIVYTVFGAPPALLHMISILGIISILVGVTLALYQWDFKRLLAYHSISQIGYIVVGVGLGTPLGILGGLFHLLNHSLFKPLLFLNAGSLEQATGTRQIKELGGLSTRMPVTAGTSMFASLAISGIPPFNGFWSKLIIILACLQSGRYGFAAAAALASILTLASFMKVQRYAFYGHLKHAHEQVTEVSASMTVPMIILALLCLFAGMLLIPGIETHFLQPAVDALLGRNAYVHRVLELYS
jgi:multicomponent Na+:H+ antiporter subunit D